jgi:hypothetical protein
MGVDDQNAEATDHGQKRKVWIESCFQRKFPKRATEYSDYRWTGLKTLNSGVRSIVQVLYKYSIRFSPQGPVLLSALQAAEPPAVTDRGQQAGRG